MKNSLFFVLSLIGIQGIAQIQLDINYTGAKNSCAIELYEFTDYILKSKQKIASVEINDITKSRTIPLTQVVNSQEYLITAEIKSKRFFAQPGFKYEISVSDSIFQIKSEDRINEQLPKLDSTIITYFDDVFQLSENKSENEQSIESTLWNLFQYGPKMKGTSFQNQLIKYKLASAECVTRAIGNQVEHYRELENTYLLGKEVQFGNPAYMEFLFDYYVRRFRQHNLRKNQYSEELTGLEVAQKEVKSIEDPVMQQLALLKLSMEAYNTSWVNSNREALEVLDSLRQTADHPKIQDAAKSIYNRLSRLQNKEQIPDFRFQDLQGTHVQLSKFQEKHVLLDFWFIGCRPCERAIPEKQRLNKQYGDLLTIISINSRNSTQEINTYRRKKNLPWVFLKAEVNDSVLDSLNIQSFPTYFLLDQERRIILSPTVNRPIDEIFKEIENQLVFTK